MSFVQWRQQTRLLAALEWLAEGRQVIDVALELGYQSQSAFTAMFRRNVGITPGEWQASNSCSCAERRCTACAHCRIFTLFFSPDHSLIPRETGASLD